LQGIALGIWKGVEPIEQRAAELMKPCEGQLDLRLNADALDDPKSRGQLYAVAKERRLAHTRLAADDEHG
jgi:hypothetical protein